MRFKATVVGTVVGASIGTILCGLCGGIVGLMSGTPLMLCSALGGAAVCGVFGFLIGVSYGADFLYNIDAWTYATVMVAGFIFVAMVQEIASRVWLVALILLLATITLGAWIL